MKLITCMTSGGTNFHIYMVQQRVGWLERWNFSPKFDLNVTISYESASGGPSVPSLCIGNCDFHGNSIRMPSSKSVPPGRGHDRVTVLIAVFDL